MKSMFTSLLQVVFFILVLSIPSIAAAGRVNISSSGISVSPSTVTIGQNFNISFSLQEYQGSSKTIEYVEIWIKDSNGNDLYRLDNSRWTNQTWNAYQTRSYSATTFLDPARRPPGQYKVAVRGYITGDPTGPFNFGIVGGVDINYYKNFTAVTPSGRVNISSSGISVSPSTVTIGQNFNISFTLQEYTGYSKTIEYVEIWIKDSNGNDLYRLDNFRWTNQTWNAYQTRSYSATTFLDPARRPPGQYKVAVRGYITGDPTGPFNFGIVGGVDINYYKNFTAVTPSGRVNISSGGISVSPSTVTIGQNFNISFSLQEYQGGSKTIEYIEIWIKDSNGNDLYRLDNFRWTNQTWNAHQTRSYSATTFLDPARRPPGQYKVAIRGYITGDPTGPFNFGIVGGVDVNYYKSFTAIAPPEGWISLSKGIEIIPSNVILGLDFTINELKLKETRGYAKTLENVVIAILDNSGKHLFDLHDYGTISFHPHQERTLHSRSGKLYDNRTPGIYKIEIRGRYNGQWFPLDTINGAVNPKPFTASRSTGYVSLSYGIKVPHTVTLGEKFDISFSLKETSGAAKAFDQVAVDILAPSGEVIFNFAVFNNVVFQPYQTISKKTSNFFYPTRSEGTYKAVVRGKLPSGEWFDFDTINSAKNNKKFEVVKEDPYYVKPTESYYLMDRLFNKEYPTIIITHGLQSKDDVSYHANKLWNGFGHNKAGTLLRKQLGAKANIIQYIWPDANQGRGGMSCDAYDKASAETEQAGKDLSDILSNIFPANYDKSVHFIGHSLGVVVNAYAIHHYFSSFNNTLIEDIQVTTLDRPDHIYKIPNIPLGCDSPGYAGSFLKKQINFLKEKGINLTVDNYYDKSFIGAGVGDTDILAGNNNYRLIESNDVGGKFFDNEAVMSIIDNNHSGVQQWYRWSIAPNNLNSDGTHYCSGTSFINKPGSFDDTLNPCNKGWYLSSIGSGTNTLQDTSRQTILLKSTQATGTNVGALINFVDSTFHTNNEKCILTQNHLTEIYTITCDESAMSHSTVDVEIPASTSYVTFDYKYTQLDDQDYFVIFIDNRPIATLKKSALSEDEYITSGLIPVKVKNSPQKLKIVLFGSGTSSGKISFSNFRSIISKTEKNFPWILLYPTFSAEP